MTENDVRFKDYINSLPKVGEDALSFGNELPVNIKGLMGRLDAATIAKLSELAKKANAVHTHSVSDITDFDYAIGEKCRTVFDFGSVTDHEIVMCILENRTPVVRTGDLREEPIVYYELTSYIEESSGYFSFRFENRESTRVKVATARSRIVETPKALKFVMTEFSLQEDLHEVRVSESEYEELEAKGEIDPTARYIIVEDD